MYRVKRKNWEKTALPITSPLTFEPARVRRRKIRSGRSGAVERAGAGDVEVAVGELGAALTEQPRSEPDDERADRDVDEEDPRPAEAAGQCPSEEDAGGSAAARDGAPDTECKVALASLAEDGGQDREGRR